MMSTHTGRAPRTLIALVAGVLLAAGLGAVLMPEARATVTVANYVFAPSPIPKIAKGQSATVKVTAVDSGGHAVPGATINMSFSPQLASTPGMAVVNGKSLAPVAQSFSTPSSGPFAGELFINYTPGNATSGQDTVTAANAAVPPSVQKSDTYSYGASEALTFTDQNGTPETQIAPPGTLGSGTRTCFELNTNTAGSSESLTVSTTENGGAFYVGPGSHGLGEDGGTNNQECSVANTASATVLLSSAPTVVTSDSQANVFVVYVPSSATGGADIITATSNQSPNLTASDLYSYQQYKYTFDPTPMAPAGSLAPGTNLDVVVQLADGSGHSLAVSGVPVYLFFDPASNSNATAAVASPESSSISTSSTPCGLEKGPFNTDNNGQILVSYTSSSQAASGVDVLTAKDSCTNSTSVGTDGYSYLAASYTMRPTPIAPAGSLPGNAPVTVTLHSFDPGDASGNTPAPNATVWLSFAQASSGGSATVNSTPLSAVPQQFTTDSSGNLPISYSTPATPPSSGTDTITANDAAVSPKVTVTDSYAYAVTHYGFSPSPIAPTGSLPASSSTPVTLTATDAGGNPVKGATVYLTFAQASGGGSATACGHNLSATPQTCTTDATTGQVAISYQTPASLPAHGGTDTITAASDSSGSNAASDSYTYISERLSISPVPLAAKASLAPRQTVTATVTVTNADGSPGAGDLAYLSFTPTNGGGTASVNGSPLSAQPRSVAADFTGKIVVTYQAPATLPAGGVDTLTAQDKPTAPVVVATSSYTFGLPQGYWLVATDGGIFSYGQSSFHGSTGNITLNQPIVGMASTPDGQGYWLVASDGGIFSFGDATFWGSAGTIKLNRPIVGMAATPDGQGYWLVASDGGIFSYGDAKFWGSTGNMKLNRPIVAMASTPSGRGYWLVASDGGIFSEGDAPFYGSAGAIKLNQPIVGMAASPDGKGYWMVATDGGIFNYGSAQYWGSTGAIKLNKPIVAMAPTSDGAGYWLGGSDGGIFSFGDATFQGSAGAMTLNKPIVGMAGFQTGTATS